MEVTIDTNDYPVYRDLTQADAWFGGSLQYAFWMSFSDDERKRMLVEATRLIDAQSWRGEACSPSSTLAFPRDGLTDCCTGNAIDGCTDFPEDAFYAVVFRQARAQMLALDGCQDQSSLAPIEPAPLFTSLPAAVIEKVACWVCELDDNGECC